MLPFLKRKQIAAVIIAKQKPDGSLEEPSEEDSLTSAIEDMFKAYESKNIGLAAKAFKSAFEILESEEDEEEEEEK